MKRYINTIILGVPIAASIYMLLLNLVIDNTELGSITQKVLFTLVLLSPGYILVFFLLKARRSKKNTKKGGKENVESN